MANTIWEGATRQALRARLARLEPTAPARWGRLDAPGMVAHLTEAARLAHGELRIPPANLPLRYYPIRKLVIHVLPFPKGAPTAKELLSRPPGNWADDVRELDRQLARFASCAPDAPMPEHPAFGPLTYHDWGVLVYRHTDHHLSQFGV